MEWEEIPTLLVEMGDSSAKVDFQIIHHSQVSNRVADLTNSTSIRIAIKSDTLVTKMQWPSATLEMVQDEIHMLLLTMVD